MCNQQIKKHIHDIWKRHWYFFQSGDEMKSPKATGSFSGMQLPDKIMKKIFYENAMRWYPSLKNITGLFSKSTHLSSID
jgi:hypothetical protein